MKPQQHQQVEKTMWSLFLKNNHFYSYKMDKRKREVKFLLTKYTEKEIIKALEKRYLHSHNTWSNKPHKKINWEELKEIVRIMKGSADTNYLKIFIQGNNNIYLASQVYGHKDYNKSVFCNNTPHNWEICEKANEIMLKGGK